jgi:chemotaxis protein histidine kinase CheA
MVYCSHCGTQNRDGSKFCNNCGARLVPESGLRCPMCSTPNPVENVFCSNCGARLVPLIAAALPETKTPAPPIKGLSLPAKAELPDESPEPEELAEPTEAERTAPLAAEESPDWLARLREREDQTPSAEEAVTAETGDEASVPDWLTRLRAAQSPEETLPAEPEAELHPQVPDWMKESAEEPAVEPEPETAPAAEEGIPGWLAYPQAESTAESPREVGKLEMPDWLQAPKPESSAVPESDEKELPDWLRQAAAESTESKTPVQAQPAEAAEAIQATEPIEEGQPTQAVVAEPIAEELEPSEPLIESLEEAESAKPFEPQPSVPSVAVPSEEDEIPDWLRTAAPPGTAVPAEPSAPSPGEVPAWVAALKPAELSAASPVPGVTDDQIEMSGPLKGLRGVLPLAVAIAEPHPIAEPPKPSQTDGGQILESILATPPQPAAPAPKPARFVLTMRPLIYLLLFLAVLVPFLLPYDLTQSTFDIAGTPTAEFYDTLQKIPANSTVLLSFDYDPSLAGEMDLQASAIVRDLVQRGVKIIAVSTLDTGPQIAQRILDPIASQAGNYAYGSKYLIVYLPGHEAGLAQLATAGLATTTDFVDQKPVAPFLTAANIRNLGDLSLVIELAGTEEPLKTWVEQVQPRAGVRIAAAVSAAVEPKARAYRNARQLTAMMAGLLGAAQFEALDNQPGLAVISVNAQTAAQWVLVFVIVLGNIVFWISRARSHAK